MYKLLSLVLFFMFSAALLTSAQSDPTGALVQLLAEKGVITSADLARISAVPASDKLNTLTALLQETGYMMIAGSPWGSAATTDACC